MSFVVQTAARRMLACASAAAAVACVLAPASALAGSTFGAAAIFTNRACTAPYGTACDTSVTPTATRIGGMGTDLSGLRDFGGGVYGMAGVNFGPGYLPTIHASAASGVATRTGTTVTGFRSYTYTGTNAIDLSLNGNLHYFNGVPNDGQLGVLNVALGIMPLSSIAGFGPGTSAATIVSDVHLDFPDCADGAVAATGYSTAGAYLNGGNNYGALNLATRCDGQAITLHTGDRFVVVATVQTIVNRGDWLDAMNTFEVQYDLDHTYYAGTTDVVDPSVFASIDGAVPEPASWALIILGFGATGAALRRRRAAALG